MDRSARKLRREELDFELLAANQRLTPEERLNAFLTHSELMLELFKAGEEIRRRRQNSNTDASLERTRSRRRSGR